MSDHVASKRAAFWRGFQVCVDERKLKVWSLVDGVTAAIMLQLELWSFGEKIERGKWARKVNLLDVVSLCVLLVMPDRSWRR
jgi:hypothetical protein